MKENQKLKNGLQNQENDEVMKKLREEMEELKE